MPAHAATAGGTGAIERFHFVEQELDLVAACALCGKSQANLGRRRRVSRRFGGERAERAVSADGVDAQLQIWCPAS